MNITLKQLRYFVAVARAGHFGQAAAMVAISQPALSVQIREFEAALGQPVLERGPRQTALTPFGQRVLARATAILSAVDDLGEMARASVDAFAGRLRLGIIPTIAPYILPQVLAELQAQYPALALDLRETLTDRLIAELRSGGLDVAILALPIDVPGFEEVTLFDEALLLVRPEGDASGPSPRVSDLKDMRLLLLEEGHCFREQALSFCGIRQGRAGLDGTSLSTLVQMVGAGAGVTLIPEMAETVEGRAAPVTITRFAAPEPTRRVGMIWRKASPLGDQFRELAGVVGRAARSG